MNGAKQEQGGPFLTGRAISVRFGRQDPHRKQEQGAQRPNGGAQGGSLAPDGRAADGRAQLRRPDCPVMVAGKQDFCRHPRGRGRARVKLGGSLGPEVPSALFRRRARQRAFEGSSAGSEVVRGDVGRASLCAGTLSHERDDARLAAASMGQSWPRARRVECALHSGRSLQNSTAVGFMDGTPE